MGEVLKGEEAAPAGVTYDKEDVLHIGANCSGVVKTGYFNPNHLTEVLKGEEAALAGVTYDKEDVLQGFCLLLDSQADDYNAHLVGAGVSLYHGRMGVDWELALIEIAATLL